MPCSPPAMAKQRRREKQPRRHLVTHLTAAARDLIPALPLRLGQRRCTPGHPGRARLGQRCRQLSSPPDRRAPRVVRPRRCHLGRERALPLPGGITARVPHAQLVPRCVSLRFSWLELEPNRKNRNQTVLFSADFSGTEFLRQSKNRTDMFG